MQVGSNSGVQWMRAMRRCWQSFGQDCCCRRTACWGLIREKVRELCSALLHMHAMMNSTWTMKIHMIAWILWLCWTLDYRWSRGLWGTIRHGITGMTRLTHGNVSLSLRRACTCVCVGTCYDASISSKESILFRNASSLSTPVQVWIQAHAVPKPYLDAWAWMLALLQDLICIRQR